MFNIFVRNHKTNGGFYKIRQKKVSNLLGVELSGICDITNLKETQVAQIKKVVNQHHLVVIKGKRKWTEDEQRAFTAKIGELEDKTIYSMPPSQIVDIPLTNKAVTNSSIYWHSDNSCQENPSHISVLQMIDIPSNGAKTSFASLIDFYKNLTDEYKEQWKGYNGIYHNKTRHPLVWKHPFNGKFTFYFDIGFISDITLRCSNKIKVPVKELNKIINYINNTLNDQESKYIHHWNIGDIVLVDNYAVVHRTDILLENEKRTLLQTTTKGIYF